MLPDWEKNIILRGSFYWQHNGVIQRTEPQLNIILSHVLPLTYTQNPRYGSHSKHQGLRVNSQLNWKMGLLCISLTSNSRKTKINISQTGEENKGL